VRTMVWGSIAAMGPVALGTEDPEAAARDAVEVLGLRRVGTHGEAVHLAAGAAHHELRYVESSSAGVDSLGLTARDGDAFLGLRRAVEEAGLRLLPRPAPAGVEGAFSFTGPEGFVIEVSHGMARDPSLGPGATTSFGPTRYGHLNVHLRDPGAMKDLLVELMGFRVSDVIGQGQGYFLRCNTEHHGVAILSGAGTFHHHAWQAQGVGDLTRLGDRLHDLGRRLLWGPVRHGAGHNIAAYYVEPSGCVVELYCDIEHIYDDLRPPVRWEAGDIWFNNWSDHVPEGFRAIGVPPLPAGR
jgi:catechol 2,3-dioxygenase